MRTPEPVAPPRLGRRRLRDIAGEMHYRLRTEADTPARKAAAIGLGTLIGCVPLYGAHLALCIVSARLLRLNRIVTYLAAHINNPLTAPWILAGSLALGHRVSRGAWPTVRLAELSRMDLLDLGRDIILGSLILGVLLGVLLGSIAWIIGRRSRHETPWRRRVEEVSRRYLTGGVFHWEFVRGKLRHDPVYRALDAALCRLGDGTLLDLGCGHGIALALAEQARDGGDPGRPTLIGVERAAAIASVARNALGGRALIVEADLTGYNPPPADLVLLVDTLHYMDAGAQERILTRAARSLRAGGRLFLREADAGGGLRFLITAALERLSALARRDWRQRFHYRTSTEWSALLAARGLDAGPPPAPRGLLFSNVLIEGRKPGA